ncbi:MAG: 23S rRNA (adenine(2503)-C(2))-methyltransferase RlmN, partial [Clostridiales bacterium]|nr:23S rRNA (adenine(2503)-C(2))-methyltransferase RlmN [Clostridiales bacterium]
MYLSDLNKQQIESLLQELGEPKYRAAQVWEWLNKGAR